MEQYNNIMLSKMRTMLQQRQRDAKASSTDILMLNERSKLMEQLIRLKDEVDGRKGQLRNQEHRFYATALHCQMPKAIRSSMVPGFKVSQGLRKEKSGRDSGMSNSYSPAAGHHVAERGLRYSLRQYDELIHHLWRALDPEQKQEVSERAFFSFLREKKILTEKKQGFSDLHIIHLKILLKLFLIN